jgi:serine/threonine protein phosphatase 1
MLKPKIRVVLDAKIPNRHPFRTALGEEVFAFGDVHGQSVQFQAALEAVGATKRVPSRKRTVVLLGDMIDRGPDSLGCVDLAMRAAQLTNADKVVPLLGNHEQFVLIGVGFAADSRPLSSFRADERAESDDYYRRADALRLWIRNGGGTVMNGRPLLEVEDVFGPDRIAWLRDLEKAYVSGSLLFIHAGMPPRMTLEKALDEPVDVEFPELREDRHFAWVRGPFLWADPGSHGHDGRFVVHGHSMPRYDDVALPRQPDRARVNLDGGSFETGAVRFGRFAGKSLTVYEAFLPRPERA